MQNLFAINGLLRRALDLHFLTIWKRLVGCKAFKQTVPIKRAYQRDIVIYQLEKLQMLEFYYFLDKYLNKQDFELSYLCPDSLYIAMRGYSLDEVFKPGLR